MKTAPKYFLLFLCTTFYLGLYSQTAYHTYFFEDDEVVFEFDLQYFKEGTRHGSLWRTDFEDIDVESVAIAGDFNDWSTDGWRMKKIGEGRFQLRKQIEDFDDAFRWEFKFVVNGKFWAEPSKDILKKTKTTQIGSLWKEVYNMELYTARQDSMANDCFFLPGYGEAKQVILSGNFNAWDESAFPMQKVDGGWETCLKLEAGRYEYKFIVDEKWIPDPNNPKVVPNQYATFNSVYEIKREVEFKLAGFTDAEQVQLAGSFTNWAEGAMRMHRAGNSWVVSLPMDGGKHLYKFIVDGEWMTDPENPIKEYDWGGNLNSVRMVE
ncbi:MAG: hypothetical protein KI786_15050 [Mameliella sp.]|nr:hypothetical protein [Phaeodactylibacter sp.]NRA51655.1 hypothetical protein [Phaeodactylibacter sp.]